MIRKIFSLILLGLCLNLASYAQEKASYATAFNVHGKSAQDIFHKLKRWCINEIKDEPMNAIVETDLYNNEGIIYFRAVIAFDYESKTSNIISKVTKIPVLGKKVKILNELSDSGLNGTITADFIFTISNEKLKVEATNFIHTSSAEGTTGALSQGLIYKEAPTEGFVLDKAKYSSMLNKALPLIEEWWNQFREDIKVALK